MTRLADWARHNAINNQTAYRWFRSVLKRFCACLYGRRVAKNRTCKAMEAAREG